LLLTDNGLTWKQPRRKIYEAEGGTGKYIMSANTGDLRKCQLWFFKDGNSFEIGPVRLGTGRIKNLMLAAEIHNVTHP
jgi:hypothetical protein